MELRRNNWGSAIRLAITWSVVAVVGALALQSFDVPQPVIVLGVIVVGFVSSWVRSAPRERNAAHRIVTVPIRSAHLPIA